MTNFFSNIINGNIAAGSQVIQINGQTIVNSSNLIEGNGNVIIKEIDIKGKVFKEIDFSLPGSFEINISPEYKGKENLIIEGEENIVSAIPEPKINKILLDTQDSFKFNKPFKITLNTSECSSLIINGVGFVSGNIEGEKLSIKTNGTGDVSLSGSVNELHLTSQGTGHIDLRDLEAKTLKVDIEGVVKTKVFASECANISATGVCKVDLYGSPNDLKTNLVGLSKINQVSSGNKLKR